MFQAAVIADALHLRNGPHIRHTSLGLVHKAEVLTVTDLDPAGTWLQATDEAGRTGWCSARYLLPLTSAPAPWLDIAVREIGIKQFADTATPQEHPRILEYLATVNDLSDRHKLDDETAWCSCFVNWCLERAGVFGTDSASAQSWHHMNWRIPLQPNSGRTGDVVVFRRGGEGSVFGHVGFLVAYDTPKDRVLVLGGNQSDAVRYAHFPLDGLHGSTRYVALSCRRV